MGWRGSLEFAKFSRKLQLYIKEFDCSVFTL
jgi:hypothetical protein